MPWRAQSISGEGPLHGWRRHVFTRTRGTRTTWPFRMLFLGLCAAIAVVSSAWWTTALAQGLVCQPSSESSDAILVDNLDTQYLLFERAEELRRAGIAHQVIVPVLAEKGSGRPNDVTAGTVELMVRIARLREVRLAPFLEQEPISLNAARDVRRFLEREGIRSVTVVTPLFRSRRSVTVYGAVLAPAGIAVRCVPVGSMRGVSEWTRTWHGIQNVTEQWGKLQYYRLYVLPRHRSH